MLKNHLRIALRSFRKNGLYSIINVLGLSIGLASAILILLYVQHELRADRHHEHYDEIYRLGIEIGIGGPPIKAGISSYPAGPDLKAHFPEVTGFVRLFSPDIFTEELLIELEDRSIYEKGILLVDSNFFDLFTHPVIYGNPEAALRHNDLAVLTRSTAERLFGPENPVGKSFRLNQEHRIEVGAVIEDIPDNAHLKFRILLYWNSMGGFLNQGVAGNSYFQNNIFTYLRANQDLNTPAFHSKVDEFLRDHVLNELDEPTAQATTYRLHFRPMRDLYFLKDEVYEPHNPEPLPAKGDRVFVYVFITIAIFLIAIAAINYMNMAIARSARRAKEVGVRKVLGADKNSLFRQFMTESILTCFAAFLLALVWVELFLPTFNDLLIKELRLGLFADPVFTLGILALVFITGLISGSYPALYLSAFRPVEVLKQQVRLSDRNLFTRKVMVGLQFTISVFMIIVTLVVLNQLHYMRNKELGYETANIMVLNLSDLEATRRESLKNELSQLDAVHHTSLSGVLPGPGMSLQQWGFNVESEEGFMNRMTAVYHVDPHFADLYRIEMAAGRFFDPELPTDLTQSFVINEAAVRLFGWDEPIGKIIDHLGSQEGNHRRVIGVIRDFHTASLEQTIPPLIMFPVETGQYLSLRLAAGAGPGIMPSIEGVWSEVAGIIPMRHQFMDDRHFLAYRSHINLGNLFTSFAILCILLSLMGLFGLSGFTAEQKTREIGIRVVHGASLKDILVLLYREYAWLMGLSIILASGFGLYFMDNWLAQFAFRVNLGVAPFFLAALVSFAVSLLTVGYHALRATGTNPVEALKYE